MEAYRRNSGHIGNQKKDIELYGNYKAKVNYNLLEQYGAKKDGKLILFTEINPTPAGEGKATTTVGLGDALNRLGKRFISLILPHIT